MFLNGFLLKALLAGLLHTNSTTASIIAPLPQRGDVVCPEGSDVTQVLLTNIIIEFPIFVNTFIVQNTVLDINNIDITINNAPTHVVTSFIGTSIGISTATVITTTAQTPAPTFIIRVDPTAVTAINERQVEDFIYIDEDGFANPDCARAALFVFQNGIISTIGGLPIGIGGHFGPFAPSKVTGAAVIEFTLIEKAGQIQIFAATATFCKLPSGEVDIFTGGSTSPVRCVTSNLFAINIAFCINGKQTLISSFTGSTSTSTSQTSVTATASEITGLSDTIATTRSTSSTNIGSSNTNATTRSMSGTDTRSSNTNTSMGSIASTTTGSSDNNNATGSTTSTNTGSSNTNTATRSYATSTITGSSNTNTATGFTTSTDTGSSNTNTATGSSTGTDTVSSNTSTAPRSSTSTDTVSSNTSTAPRSSTSTDTGSSNINTATPSGVTRTTTASEFSVETSSGPTSSASAPACTAPNQVVSSASNICVCAPGFADSGLTPGQLDCVSSPSCPLANTVLDIVTNSCVCIDGLINSSLVPGVLKCVDATLCLVTGSTFDPNIGACLCNPGLNPTTVLGVLVACT